MNTELKQIPLKILLAEDDRDDRFFFEKALKEINIGTQLATVNDGDELMDYLFKNIHQLPDIIFLDLSMPRKTGYECLAEMKENILLKEIPVVMFSTFYARDINYEKNITDMLDEIGAHDHIRKPGSFEQLKIVIKNALDKIIEKAAS
ncbi:response regulator [Ferruginibacter sp.]